jgi:hypothetical protein
MNFVVDRLVLVGESETEKRVREKAQNWSEGRQSGRVSLHMQEPPLTELKIETNSPNQIQDEVLTLVRRIFRERLRDGVNTALTLTQLKGGVTNLCRLTTLYTKISDLQS